MSKNKERIIQSAREFFSKQDFERVSVKEICARAGVACSTFYYHFESKEQLMDYLRAIDDQQRPEDLIALLTRPNSWEQMLAVCSICAKRAKRAGHKLTAQYIRRKLSGTDEEEMDEGEHGLGQAQKQEVMALLTARAQKEGEVRNPNDPAQLAEAAFHLADGLMLGWSASDGAFPLEEAVRAALEVLFDVREDLRKGGA
ncbi:MAG: helix-turn-helix domain-containing protein [Clostridia bacterium]